VTASHDRALHLQRERLLFARLRKSGRAEDRERLVRSHLPLAHSLAARYRASDEPFEDLLQVAYVGLLNAIDRFDPERGTAFSTFAVPTILGELRRYFRDRTWALRVPRDGQELYLRIERARDALAVSLGRQATTAELATHLHATEEQVMEAAHLDVAYRAGPLEAPPPQIDRGYERAEHRAVLDALLPALSPLEAEIVRLRFHEDLTQEQIGRRVGVTQMRVSRVLHQSIARLRLAAAA
jgi:RNA polymerase sigma-B factor